MVVAIGVKKTQTYEVRAAGSLAVAQTVTRAGLVAVPAGSVMVSGAFSASSASAALDKAMSFIGGKTLGVPLQSNEEVSSSMFSSNSGLKLNGNQLVSVGATVSNAVGGSLSVGDMVDVVTFTNGQTVNLTPSGGAKVVSILPSQDTYNSAIQNQSSNPSASSSNLLPSHPIPGIYVLEVNASDAAKLAGVQATSSSGTLGIVYCQQGSC